MILWNIDEKQCKDEIANWWASQSSIINDKTKIKLDYNLRRKIFNKPWTNCYKRDWICLTSITIKVGCIW
jgi:hypothetical protein